MSRLSNQRRNSASILQQIQSDFAIPDEALKLGQHCRVATLKDIHKKTFYSIGNSSNNLIFELYIGRLLRQMMVSDSSGTQKVLYSRDIEILAHFSQGHSVSGSTMENSCPTLSIKWCLDGCTSCSVNHYKTIDTLDKDVPVHRYWLCPVTSQEMSFPQVGQL